MRCRYCDTEMDVITVFDAEAKPLKMYECPTCGATSMGELKNIPKTHANRLYIR